MEKTGILLLSGGMDSTTLLADILNQGWIIHPVVFDYGQQHRIAENDAAAKVFGFYSRKYPGQLKPYKIITIDLRQIGNSALTDSSIPVPDNMKDQPKTVVPHRNTLMTTLAAAYGGSLGVYNIFLTPVKDDDENYPDCRRPFFDSLQETLSRSAERAVVVHTPYVHMWKAEVVALGKTLEVPYNLTHSCYKGVLGGCKVCPACRERIAAFEANGLIIA